MSDREIIARLNELAGFLSRCKRTAAASWCRDAAKRLKQLSKVDKMERIPQMVGKFAVRRVSAGNSSLKKVWQLNPQTSV